MARRIRTDSHRSLRRVRGRGAKRSPAQPLPELRELVHDYGHIQPIADLARRIIHGEKLKIDLAPDKPNTEMVTIDITPEFIEQLPQATFERIMKEAIHQDRRQLAQAARMRAHHVSSEQARRLYPSHEVNEFRALEVSAFNVGHACKTWVEHHFVTGQDPAPPMAEISHLLECLTKVLWKHCEKAPQIARTIYGKPFVRNGEGDAADSKASTRSASKSDNHGSMHVGRTSPKKAKPKRDRNTKRKRRGRAKRVT